MEIDGTSEWRFVNNQPEPVAGWTPISDDDPLNGPPAGTSPNVADPLVQRLPYRAIGWENFEKLLLRVARQIEGLVNVMRYGVGGQAQQGIDMVGWTTSEEAHVLQGKNVEAFDESSLADAIEQFGDGTRPFDPTRIVFGVAVPANRTQVVDGLAEARRELGIDVELYDADRLDELLRDHPRIVEEFFGEGVAQRFCGSAFQTDSASTTEMDATLKAFAVGPIRALGLEDLEKRAFELQDPVDQSDALLQLAEGLSARGWEQNAKIFRGQARELLIQSVRQTKSPDTALRLARLTYLDACAALTVGEARSASASSHTLAGLVGPAPFPTSVTPDGAPPEFELPDPDRWRARSECVASGARALTEPFPGLTGGLASFGQSVERLFDIGDESAPVLRITEIPHPRSLKFPTP
jgi:hypothetical protein